MRHRVKDQLHATRHPEFVENAEHVVLNRVLTKIELVGNPTVGESFRHGTNYGLLAFRQQHTALGIDKRYGDGLSNRLQQELSCGLVRPYLPVLDATDAFNQEVDRPALEEYAACTGAE